MKPSSFDHVALWVTRRDEISHFLCAHLGMHEIEKTDDFTLVGVDAREGKITLFDEEGPREHGALQRIVLRVPNLEAALAKLPEGTRIEEQEGVAAFEGPEGLQLGLTEREGLEYDLDHVVLSVPNPDAATARFEELGFERRDGVLAVGDREVRLIGGGNGEVERPLLNHLALLVDSAGDVEEEARERGIEIADIKDAANTLAVFVWGPDSVKVEYVEHKPGFSLV